MHFLLQVRSTLQVPNFYSRLLHLGAMQSASFATLVLLGTVDALVPQSRVAVSAGSAARAGRISAVVEAPTASDGYRTRDQLKKGIASFYDGSSALWERVWGEHMHHGYYPNSEPKDHRQAQSDMIDEVLKWAREKGEAKPVRVLDVGCGIGGSTRHIAREFGCKGRGITLSPYQAGRANELSAAAGLGDSLGFEVALHSRAASPVRRTTSQPSERHEPRPPNYARPQPRPQVADALDMPFPDNSFDLVWSLESGAHPC